MGVGNETVKPTKRKLLTIVLFQNKRKEFCWHVIASNGEVWYQGESHPTKQKLLRKVKAIKDHIDSEKCDVRINDELPVSDGRG